MLLKPMPIKGEHYLGLDLDNLKRFEEQLQDQELLAKIAKQARDWALLNYSPKAVTLRFFRLISYYLHLIKLLIFADWLADFCLLPTF